MILKRFYEESLAQASFLVGCARTGEAIVIDANRDVEQYIRAAGAEGLRIAAVTETHIHADYVSGSLDLAERTGATLYLSDEGDADWKYAFADRPNVRLVRHGDTIQVGNVRLDVRRTPGHTPEHLAFVLTDGAASTEPLGVFTGDFVFAGDVGRPDLLERAANYAGTMERGARTLFDSIQAFRTYPDRLLVWPGHGSGSACGKSLGGVPVSTVGYEKLVNWGLRLTDRDAFVAEVLAGQPEPPAYFKHMKRINREGPPARHGFAPPARMSGEDLHTRLGAGETVVDIRNTPEAAAAYMPGTITIPLARSFTTWAGSLLPYDRPLYLLADDEEQVRTAVRELALIGLDDVRGWCGADAIRELESAGVRAEARGGIDPREALQRMRQGAAVLVDVRGRREYEEGHIPGARHVPLGSLPSIISALPVQPVVVHCASGARSAIAVSLLRRAGRTDVLDMPGGFTRYEAEGLPVETGGGDGEMNQAGATAGSAASA